MGEVATPALLVLQRLGGLRDERRGAARRVKGLTYIHTYIHMYVCMTDLAWELAVVA